MDAHLKWMELWHQTIPDHPQQNSQGSETKKKLNQKLIPRGWTRFHFNSHGALSHFITRFLFKQLKGYLEHPPVVDGTTFVSLNMLWVLYLNTGKPMENHWIRWSFVHGFTRWKWTTVLATPKLKITTRPRMENRIPFPSNQLFMAPLIHILIWYIYIYVQYMYIYLYIYYDCYILVPLIIDHKFFWCGVIILFQSLIYVSFFFGSGTWALCNFWGKFVTRRNQLGWPNIPRS